MSVVKISKSSFSKGLLLLILGSSCHFAQSQQSNSISRIEFSTLSRGGYQELVIIAMDSVKISIQELRGNLPESYSRALKKDEWNSLLKTLGNISLEEVPEMKSPTMKRAYDGAMHSSITVVTAREDSYNHSFDDENPHEKLGPLLKVIKQIVDQTLVDVRK